MKQIDTWKMHENDQYWNTAVRSWTEPFQIAHHIGDEGSFLPPVGKLCSEKNKIFPYVLICCFQPSNMMEKDPLFLLPWHGMWCKGTLLLLKRISYKANDRWFTSINCRFTDLRTQSLGAQMLLRSLSYHVLQEMLFFWEIVRLDSPIFCRAE